MRDKRSRKQVAKTLLETYGSTFAEDLEIDLQRDSAEALFCLLIASKLLSARIRSSVAMKATRALFGKGWTTPVKLAGATWKARTMTLNQAGYARYDESTSRMLGDTAQMVLDKYDGDLRKLREEADRDPQRERQLLKQFKGIGDVGADIFCREVQVIWDELRPFADEKVLKAAKELHLGGSATELAELVGRQDFPRLVSALIKTQLRGDYERVREAAGV